MSPFNNHNLSRRSFLQSSAASIAALSGGAMFAQRPVQMQMTQFAAAGGLATKYVPLANDIAQVVAARVRQKYRRGAAAPGGLAAKPGRKGGRQPAPAGELTSRNRTLLQPLVDDFRGAPALEDFVTAAPPARAGGNGIRGGREGFTSPNQQSGPPRRTKPGVGPSDIAATSTPHTVAAVKHNLGNKVGDLEYVRDRHDRLLTRQRWTGGATYYMGPGINNGNAVALFGDFYNLYKQKGDAEGILGAPLKAQTSHQGRSAVETFFGRMLNENGSNKAQLLSGYNIVLERMVIKEQTGDDIFSGFSDLRVDCYLTHPDATVSQGDHYDFYGYENQVVEPYKLLGTVNLEKSPVLVPTTIAYSLMLTERDQSSLAQAIAGEIEDEVRMRLAQAAVAAGTTLAALLTLPKLAALLAAAFATLFAFVADKVFDFVKELFEDDYSDLVTQVVNLKSAWHPHAEPYWADHIDHNGIEIHSGGKNGVVDVKIILDKKWRDA